MRWRTAAVFVMLVGCSGGARDALVRAPAPTTTSTATTVVATTATRRAATTATPATTTTTGRRGPVLVRYRIEVHTGDAATADFPAVVDATLGDPRGWQRAGFVLQRADAAPYTILIAEGPEVQQRCRPYDTYGKYSCQLGPLVAITADRWREATPEWTGDLATYRQMLVNHEVGHLLGLHHRKCPGSGQVAPVMSQQSTNLDGCRPNPWPVPAELERAARHDLPLAPPYERDTVDQ